jgi:hypothetical protein
VKTLRASFAVAVLALSAGIGLASIGVNSMLDLNTDGSPGVVPSLTTLKAGFSDAGDGAKFDAAIATLTAASSTSVSADIKSYQKALKQLGKLANDAMVLPQIQKNLTTAVHAQVFGYNAQGGAAASNYYAGKPFNIKNGIALGKIVKAVSGRLTKLNAELANTTMTPAKRLALYLSVAKASDKLIKKYGAV